ncbi:hypothetical protein [Marinicella meishanensis]|uniref:hypothetical protein n=1 Tax=Marinicella meishanensis TaxID=2873263 RepID=UPI001CBDB62C|nr:hypothetical protein [Marinicella sp. NBU2979]
MKTVLLLVSLSSMVATSQADLIEIGSNDMLVSQVAGTVDDPNIDADDPALAHNPNNDTFLAVWAENSDPAGFEIFARLLRADGMPLGNQVVISDIPVNDNLTAFEPKVAFNSIRNEFLVVWFGNDFEIYARRVSPNLTLLGPELPISDINQLPSRGARSPAVAFNDLNDEYLVVWYADDPAAGLADDEFEIFGQRLNGDGSEIGDNDFRISDVAGTGDADRMASQVDVAFNSANAEYLVVWVADDNLAGQVDQEFEIFGQILDSVGTEVGNNDFRVSFMGGTGLIEYDAQMPAVAPNTINGDWMVVWYGDDNNQGLIDEEFEIHGRLLTAGGQDLTDFRVSTMGGTGNGDYQAFRPDVVHNPVTREYAVSWQGDAITYQGGGPTSDEYEIWVHRVTESGEPLLRSSVVSDMGDDGSQFDARTSALAVDARGEILVLWNGTDDVNGGAIGEFGVHAQKLAEVPIFADGLE